MCGEVSARLGRLDGGHRGTGRGGGLTARFLRSSNPTIPDRVDQERWLS